MRQIAQNPAFVPPEPYKKPGPLFDLPHQLPRWARVAIWLALLGLGFLGLWLGQK